MNRRIAKTVYALIVIANAGVSCHILWDLKKPKSEFMGDRGDIGGSAGSVEALEAHLGNAQIRQSSATASEKSGGNGEAIKLDDSLLEVPWELARLGLFNLIPFERSRLTDEYCRRVGIGTPEQSALNNALRNAIAQVQKVELDGAVTGNDDQGQRWIEITHDAPALRRIKDQLEDAVHKILPDYRGQVTVERIFTHSFFDEKSGLTAFHLEPSGVNVQVLVGGIDEFGNYSEGVASMSIDYLADRYGHIIDAPVATPTRSQDLPTSR